MKEFVEKLRKRAERFLVDAEFDLKDGAYEIAVFHAEQAAQLFLKAKILSFGVEFPKTHEISKLLEILEKLGMEKVKEIKEEKNIIELLEFAYISSRYLPFSISKEEAQKAIKFVKKLRRLLWKK